MSDITGNTCEIITIFPLEVECNVTNASTNLSVDGSIDLLINGGTAPYVVTWSNGQQGKTLITLSAGTYSATVVDYYGDYTATTQCEVGYDTFYLSKLTECSNPSNIIYLTNTGFDESIVYSFNEIQGCYEFVEEILHSSESYSALTISNQYENGCNECDPPQPSPPAQIDMCLSNGQDTQYTFTYSSTDLNGNYVWTSGSLTLSYNQNGGYWEITPWAIGGNMKLYQNPVSSYPLGAWTNYGVNSRFEWNMTSGECVGLPLSVSAQATDANCVGENGSVVLTGSNGTPSYAYSIQSYAIPQQSGTFINVPPGTYTGVVQDSANPPNSSTVQFTIGAGTPSQTYSFYITQVGSTTTTPNNVNDSVTTTHSYDITINPPLPSGVSMDGILQIYHLREKSGDQPQPNSTVFTVSHQFLKNNTTPISTTDTTPTTSYGTSCGNILSPQSIYNTNTPNITFNSGDYVRVNITQTVDLNTLTDNCECPTKGRYMTTVKVTPEGIQGGSCNNYTTTQIQSTPVETIRQGCEITSSCKTYEVEALALRFNYDFTYTDCTTNQTVTGSVNASSPVTVCSTTVPQFLQQNVGTVTLISSTCT